VEETAPVSFPALSFTEILARSSSPVYFLVIVIVVPFIPSIVLIIVRGVGKLVIHVMAELAFVPSVTIAIFHVVSAWTYFPATV
jgi:hypothetical protein